MTRNWIERVLETGLPDEGGTVTRRGQQFVVRDGILRAQALLTATQRQTAEAFGFKWEKRDTYDSPQVRDHVHRWLAKYGDISALIDSIRTRGDGAPIVLDAGCGSGMTGYELFAPVFSRIGYLGADVSTAVDVARQRAAERGLGDTFFVQADLLQLPIADASVDIVYSEGVLHHTDSTEIALKGVCRYLKPGGLALFYVYRKKGPIREFTDDFIREKLQSMSPQEGWDALQSLTRFGAMLGELNLEVYVPEDVKLLDIPAGKVNLQRLFYWHVFKAFYREDFTFEEMLHANYDWFAPANAHRQTPEQVREWCEQSGLDIEREILEEAGITIIARKRH